MYLHATPSVYSICQLGNLSDLEKSFIFLLSQIHIGLVKFPQHTPGVSGKASQTAQPALIPSAEPHIIPLHGLQPNPASPVLTESGNTFCYTLVLPLFTLAYGKSLTLPRSKDVPLHTAAHGLVSCGLHCSPRSKHTSTKSSATWKPLVSTITPHSVPHPEPHPHAWGQSDSVSRPFTNRCW